MNGGLIRRTLVALVFLACARTSMATPIVTVSPAIKNVAVGDTFALDVTISNVTDLFAFQFDLSFNPAVIHANGVVEGPFLATGGSTVFSAGSIDNVLGNISSVTDSLVGAISGVSTVGPAVLASATFTAFGPGSSPISLSNILLLDSNLDIINFDTADGTVNVRQVAAVPEPATVTLGIIGLAGMASRYRRRRVRSDA